MGGYERYRVSRVETVLNVMDASVNVAGMLQMAEYVYRWLSPHVKESRCIWAEYQSRQKVYSTIALCSIYIHTVFIQAVVLWI